MPVVVGISWPVQHDHSVAAIIDGRLVFATEEERYTRHKHSYAELPINSMFQVCKFLESSGISPRDIDAFAINYDPGLMPRRMRERFTRLSAYRMAQNGTIFEDGKTTPYDALRLAFNSYFKSSYFMELAKVFIINVFHKMNAPLPRKLKVIPVGHHLTHAASAYYFSGFPSAAILTVDGSGETESTAFWHVKNGEFEQIARIPVEEGSIGNLYENISVLLGFTLLEGPGKVMGLAPYGKARKDIAERFQEAILVQEAGDLPYRFHFRMENLRMLLGNLNLSWNPRGEMNSDTADVAWWLQNCTERLLIASARWLKEQAGEDKLSLAGGVALNAKANMKIHYSKLYNDIFIFPAANDAGGPVGAAAYVYEHVLGERMINERLTNVYLGPEYPDDSLIREVKGGKWNADYVGEDVSGVASLVSRGKVVAWYQGRAELGPRALGNRSIIADPRNKDTWRIVNEIKGREWWRPMAPSLMYESLRNYLVNPVHHQFMILMQNLSEEASARVPAVSHVDRTTRPQSVKKEENKTWYGLLKAFEEESGEGVVVNTSFNLAGEPLVETRRDALTSFALGGLDALYLDGWLISKQ